MGIKRIGVEMSMLGKRDTARYGFEVARRD
jgi:hypothetical protein